MHGLILNGSKNVFEVECEDGLTRDCSIKGKILKSDKDYYNPIAPGDIVELEEASLEEKKGRIIRVQERLKNWEDIGYKVIRLSAKTGEGMVELASLLENHLSALVGQSGVGKSSIINVLDNDVVLKTGSLSQKYGRGKHTTTKGSLMHIQIDEALIGGIVGACADIIDTPGVRRFILHGIDADDLALYFRDFKPYLGKCSFGMSCSHLSEKGCAIKQAVEEGEISPLRYDSWKRICSEMKNGTWED